MTKREVFFSIAFFILGGLAMLLAFVLVIMWHGR